MDLEREEERQDFAANEDGDEPFGQENDSAAEGDSNESHDTDDSDTMGGDFEEILKTLRDSNVLKTFRSLGELTDGQWSELVDAIQANKNLECVAFNPQFFRPAPAEPLRRLLSWSGAAASTSNLKRIELRIDASQLDVKSLFQCLEGNSTVTYLSLATLDSCKLSLQDFQTVFGSLRKNKTLLDVRFQCDALPLADENEAKTLLQELESCPNLRYFCGDSEYSSGTALDNAIRRGRSLTRLEPYHFVRQGGGMNQFFQAIAESKISRDFDISALSRVMSVRELNSLIHELPRMNTLVRLEIETGSQRLNAVVQEDLLRALDENTNLEHLHIFGASEMNALFHSKALFFPTRNRIRKQLEEGISLPCVHLWPRILYSVNQDEGNGVSLLFWALRSYSCHAGIYSQRIANSGPHSEDVQPVLEDNLHCPMIVVEPDEPKSHLSAESNSVSCCGQEDAVMHDNDCLAWIGDGDYFCLDTKHLDDKDDIQDILYAVRYSTSLKKFLAWGELTYNQWEQVVDAVQANKRIKSVKINPENPDSALTIPLCNLLSGSTTSLRNVELQIDASQVDVIRLFNSLEMNSTVTQFMLLCGESYQITLQDYQSIFSSLRKNTTLREFILQCDGLHLASKNNVKTLLQEIESCNNLQLFFAAGKDYNELDLENAVDSLIRSNRPVSKFDLSHFVGHDRSWEKIFEAVSESDAHRDLDISGPGPDRVITRKELNVLIQNLPKMETLVQLEFDLGTVHLDDHTQTSFLRALDENTSLKYLLIRGDEDAMGAFFTSADYFPTRNRLQSLLTKNGTKQPPLNLWPRILFSADQHISGHGQSLLFWTLQSYSSHIFSRVKVTGTNANGDCKTGADEGTMPRNLFP